MTEASLYCRVPLTYSLDGAPVRVEVDILNGRLARLPGWETCGFELFDAPSRVADWHDPKEVEARHFEEVTELCKRLTGCAHVIYYPPLLRSPEGAARHPDLAPIQLVHSDYTESYRGMIEDPVHPYHRILEPSMARAGLTAANLAKASRVLTLQLWRNIGDPAIDYPLCLCDCRTVSRDQLTPIRVAEYGGLRTEFDAFAVAPPRNDEHSWYTFPQMNVDEVVLFRAFDSERMTDGRPFWTPHTSFRDPRQPADVPARRSLEMRAICLFD